MNRRLGDLAAVGGAKSPGLKKNIAQSRGIDILAREKT
jgi:hypothetical protein